MVEIAEVEQFAGGEANSKDQKDLDGAYPADFRRSVLGERHSLGGCEGMSVEEGVGPTV